MTTVTRYKNVRATGTGPRLESLTNIVNNPRAVNLEGLRYSPGTGGVATMSLLSTGGPLPECPSFLRLNWTSAQTATTSAASITNTRDGYNLVAPGKTYTYRAWVRSSFATTMQVKAAAYAGGTYLSTLLGVATAIPANQWKQLELQVLAPAGVNRLTLNTDPAPGAPLVPQGASIDATGWMVVETPPGIATTVAYGDGDMTGWAWGGDRHASPSSGYGAIIN